MLELGAAWRPEQMTEHIVARHGEIPDRGRKIVTIKGRSIGIFNVSDRFYAVRNACAHQSGPVCEGGLFARHLARIDADRHVTEYVDHDNPVLSCPHHGWEYDLESGSCLADPTRRIAVYAVRVKDDGDVAIEVRD